ncbi:MAG: polymer-forming cytoskeletal protein [Proteobacteria bacterium]|nr:polymer-forming cytoskeletal protein [Pseudomonadota bacterium]
MNPFEFTLMVVFSLGTMTFLTLPFLPAWREWRDPSDEAALPVPAHDSNQVSHFANSWRRQRDGDGLDASSTDTSKELQLQHMFDVRAVQAWNHTDSPVVATRTVVLATPVECLRPVHAALDFRAAGGSTFSAIMSSGCIKLGPLSRVTEWAHGDKGLRLGGFSIGLRRLSSDGTIELGNGCCFERMHAPAVQFGATPAKSERPGASAGQPSELSQLSGAEHRGGHLYRVNGNCTIPENRHYIGSLIVTGILTIGAFTRIEGDVKARQGIRLGFHAKVLGAVICEDTIHFLAGSSADGPVTSETHVLLDHGTQVGHQHAPTSISAPTIIAESGAVAHGTVWAREAGVVWGLA